MTLPFRGSRSETETTQAGKVRAPRCPQCFSRDATVLAELTPDLDQPWRVVRCADCAMLFTSPQPDWDDWDRWYPPDYEPHQPRQRARGWRRDLMTRLRRRLAQTALGTGKRPSGLLRRGVERFALPGDRKLMLPFGSGRLLDFGCGVGGYLANMRGLGWRGIGVDKSRRAAERAAALHDIPVLIGTLPNGDLTPESFDLVTAWEVLEHVERPRQALSAIRELLAPRGWLALSVPNIAGWAARHYLEHWVGLDLPRHRVHFTPATLTRMVRAEGFQIVSQSTISHSGWIRQSARGTRLCRPNARERLLGTKLVSRLTVAWGRAMGRGESILLIAEKR